MVKQFPVIDSRKHYSLIHEQIFAESDREQADRRSTARYPLELRLRFRELRHGTTCTGDGWSLNVSTRGILVRPETDATVLLGSKLEIVLEWPILLDGTVCLQLMTIGRVVRSDVRGFGVAIQRHNFRTTKKTNRSAEQWLPDDAFSA